MVNDFYIKLYNKLNKVYIMHTEYVNLIIILIICRYISMLYLNKPISSLRRTCLFIYKRAFYESSRMFAVSTPP